MTAGKWQRSHSDKLNKHYGSVFHAVKDVDLEIADKEFVALVGPSGCGKSTTLRMIAGLEDISSGDIRIGGKVVNHLPPRDRDVAMVFQNYALYQHLSVYDNLAFGLRNRKTPEAEIKAAIDRAAGMLGLHELLQRKPKQLSGGQQQRVALGRCIVRNPQVFLFDEPLSNLDAKLRAHMRIEIKRLHAADSNNLGVRDPRPGRGHDAWRPRRRSCATAGFSRSARRCRFTASPPTSSSRASSARLR